MPVMLNIAPGVPHARMTTTLDGTPYILDLRWNARAATWLLDVLADDETPIVHGLALVLGTLAGRRVADLRMPGCFTVTDLSGQHRESTADDLGSRVVVHFWPYSELVG